jgi:Rha family phage regulatory protein
VTQEKPPISLKPRLKIIDGQITTTSLDVAEKFGKSHDNVLRDIRNLLESVPATFASLNFEEVKETMSYKNAIGESITKETSRTGHYRMTKDGFMFLAMGFTGKEAAQWKVAYITAFNLMETRLVEAMRALKQIEQSGIGKPLNFSDPDNLPAMTPEVFLRLLEVFDRHPTLAIVVWWALQKEAHKAPVVTSYRDIERDVHHLVGRSSLHSAVKKLALENIFSITEVLNASGQKATGIELILDVLAEKVAARLSKKGLESLFSDDGLTALVADVQSVVLH